VTGEASVPPAGTRAGVTVTLYTRVGCHLCERAEQVVRAEQEVIPFKLGTVDVDGDPELTRRYGVRVPVLAVDGVELFEYEVPVDLLRACLSERWNV
jgi:glutaredoxin